MFVYSSRLSPKKIFKEPTRSTAEKLGARYVGGVLGAAAKKFKHREHFLGTPGCRASVRQQHCSYNLCVLAQATKATVWATHHHLTLLLIT